jgi:phosphoglycerol transferase MdoB-like AlkP superfamily enzyme
VLFAAAIAAKVWAVQLFVLDGSNLPGLMFDALFVFVLLASVDLFFADMRFRALLIVDAVLSVLLLAVAVYHSYYGILPSRESLAMLGQATAVGSSITSLLNPLYLALFVDIPLFAWWVIRSRRRGVDPATGRRPGVLIVPGLRTPYVYQRRTLYFLAVAAAFAFGLGVQAARGGSQATDSAAIARNRGVMTYISVALMGAPQRVLATGALTGDGLQTRIEELSGRETAAPLAGFTPGMAAGSNVIIIQVEALQSIAVGHSVGGMDVTPNLDALIKDSWYFPNCVSAAGVGTTADVEFATNTSLYPPSEVGASLGWSDRELTSMPRILDAQGYESYTFHTNEAGFWNRSQFYPAVGFTRYFDRSHFGTADKMAFNSASDRVLFEKTLPELKNATQANRPFYAQIIMMSSHFPFENVPSDRRKLRLEALYKGTIVGNYLTEIHYADAQIGYFISELKQAGLWDDSIVVVYGDHFGLPEPRSDSEATALRALAGHDYNDADKALVPLIIHLPGQTDGTQVAVPVGQIDLTPTLADAMDVDLSGMVHFGRSILRSGGGVIAASGLLGLGAFVDESVLYVPGVEFVSGQVFDVRTREELPISAASESTFENVKELLLLSRDYVASLPLREDFNPNAEITFPRKR